MPAVSPRQIIRLYVEDLGYQKYFLVVGIDGDHPLLFYISSQVYEYVLTRDYLWPFQVEITKEQHPFMPNDRSWMNCTEVCIDHNFASIEYKLREEASGKICGTVHADARAKVINAVKDSANETISERHRRIILASL